MCVHAVHVKNKEMNMQTCVAECSCYSTTQSVVLLLSWCGGGREGERERKRGRERKGGGREIKGC